MIYEIYGICGMLIIELLKIGNQKLETLLNITTSLPVVESFYTIQGEGFHQGKAAYFIRLGGCDVGCFWCDVKESWDASKHPIKTINEIVEEAGSHPRYLCRGR